MLLFWLIHNCRFKVIDRLKAKCFIYILFFSKVIFCYEYPFIISAGENEWNTKVGRWGNIRLSIESSDSLRILKMTWDGYLMAVHLFIHVIKHYQPSLGRLAFKFVMSIPTQCCLPQWTAQSKKKEQWIQTVLLCLQCWNVTFHIG